MNYRLMYIVLTIWPCIIWQLRIFWNYRTMTELKELRALYVFHISGIATVYNQYGIYIAKHNYKTMKHSWQTCFQRNDFINLKLRSIWFYEIPNISTCNLQHENKNMSIVYFQLAINISPSTMFISAKIMQQLLTLKLLSCMYQTTL